jgi:archaellum component FlaC
VNKTEYIGKLNALYVGEKNCLEELITIYDEKDKEIERLKERIEDLNTINGEHQILNGMIRKELQQKESIIKEAREKIDNTTINCEGVAEDLVCYIYEILDKERI